MKITILGCGGSAGVPMVGGENGQGLWGRCDPAQPRNRRSRSSIILTNDDGLSLLVDSGPDLRDQFLKTHTAAVHAVVYTHPHSDHVAGLDELRAVNRVIEAPLPLYATADVMQELKARFEYAFRPWSGNGFFRPVFETYEISYGDDLTIAGFSLQLFEQRHGRGLSLGFRCGDFAYSTDVEFLSDEALSILSGVDTWVVGCFQHAPHIAHAWVDLVLEWRQIVRPRRLILTHMGPDMDYDGLCAELPEGVEPAFDGMVITLT